ncbi:MAG TPA: hypothetical protein V6D22_23075 [Candidatus Obscuribacterales bacterium]
MDKEHAKRILERLEAERSVHDEKFASQPLHKDCLRRFDSVIAALREQYDDATCSRLDYATNECALPDAICFARVLMDTAQEMSLEKEDEAAELMHQRALETVMTELNELDGFAC